MNRENKRWCFTWETNVKQRRLPNQEKLAAFLDGIVEWGVFQKEEGAKKKKKHWQGYFELLGRRSSKEKLLNKFRTKFKNVAGLTLTVSHDKMASRRYAQKKESRLEGPFFCGVGAKNDKAMSNMKLREWQKDLYEILKSRVKSGNDRTVICVSNPSGGSGKSAMLKWLHSETSCINAHKLPVTSVDRLLSATVKLSKRYSEGVDLFMINLTKSKGKEQNYCDLFAAIEDIKDGYVVDCMYGNYQEAVFSSPVVLIMTNLKPAELLDYLSFDRWELYTIILDELIEWNVMDLLKEMKKN